MVCRLHCPGGPIVRCQPSERALELPHLAHQTVGIFQKCRHGERLREYKKGLSKAPVANVKTAFRPWLSARYCSDLQCRWDATCTVRKLGGRTEARVV